MAKKRAKPKAPKPPKPKAPQPAKEEQLNEALEELAGAGQLDSHGVFTLATEEAVRKLGAHQLPTPQSWILVLVQAANRAGATLIKVRQSKAQTRIEIEGFPNWDWDEMEAVLAETGTGSSPLSALATVLRALAGAADPHEFSLTSPGGTVIGWVDENWTRHQERRLFSFGKSLTTLTFSHLPESAQELGFFDRGRRARVELTELYRLLARDALASSVPILCDGRTLTGLELGGVPQAVGVTQSGTRQRRQVALVPFELPSARSIAFPVPTRWDTSENWERELGSRFRVPGSLEPPRSGKLEAAGVALLFIALCYSGTGKHATLELDQASSSLSWVKDGVIVERQTMKIRGALGVRAYVDASELPTDLSGLALRQDKQLRNSWVEIRKALPKALRELSSQTNDGVKVDAKWQPLYTAVVGALAGTAITVGTGNPLYGLIAFGSMWSHASDHKASLKKMDAQLDTELEALSEAVSRALR